MAAVQLRWRERWRRGLACYDAWLDPQRWRQLWAARQMRRQRADYYSFLALRLRDARHVTLRQLFDADAKRYGMRHPRGLLSAHWAERCQDDGGGIARLWHGVFPAAELRVLQLGQHAGGDGLAQTLEDLGQALRLFHTLQQAVWQTLASAVLACLAASVMVAAIPLWTAPRLAGLFDAVPAAYRGAAATHLFALADLLTAGGPWLALTAAAVAAALPWTFLRVSGRARLWLDQFAPWRLQRDVHAVRCLALLQILLQPRGGMVTPLRTQLDLLWDVSAPWLQWHVLRMQQALSAGRPVCAIFATGLFDAELRWLLDDMVTAHGLAEGMARVRPRLETQMRTQLLARARCWRWLLLLGAAAAALLLLGWHYVVIDDLRRALVLSSAGGQW